MATNSATNSATKSRTKPRAKSKTAELATVAKGATVTSNAKAAKLSVTSKTSAGESVSKKMIVPNQKPAQKKIATKEMKLSGKKQKTIRDSFNMPADDYGLISAMKKRAVGTGREMKKSELLRAGIKSLAGMTDAAFVQAIDAVKTVKTGRPSKKH